MSNVVHHRWNRPGKVDRRKCCS